MAFLNLPQNMFVALVKNCSVGFLINQVLGESSLCQHFYKNISSFVSLKPDLKKDLWMKSICNSPKNPN